MSDPTQKHVVKHNDGWAVKNEGAARVSSTHQTQQSAINAGTNSLGSSKGGELYIHNKEGAIRDRRTIAPAKDPYPPKG